MATALFGGITTDTKAKSLAVAAKDRVDDYILVNHFNPDEDYYLFLLEGAPKNRSLIREVQKKIDEQGYQSYIIASATTKVFDKGDIKQISDHMDVFKSQWRNLINYNGVHVSAIMAFGASLYAINKGTDLMTSQFYDQWMNKPYYYMGHGFIGNYDTFIFPVDGVDQLYPSEYGNHVPFKQDESVINWKTRFFFSQLKNMMGRKVLPDDMSDFTITVCDTESQASEILDSLMDSEILAWDTETNSLKWFRKTSHIHCFTFCNNGKDGYYIPADMIFQSRVLRRKLCAVFYSCGIMVGANIKFDLHFAKHDLPELDLNRINHIVLNREMVIEDVGQLSHAINSTDGFKGLKTLTFLYTPFGGYDDDLDIFKKRAKISNYSLIPTPILSRYATIDAIVTYRIWKALKRHAAEVDAKFPNDKPLKEWGVEKWYHSVMSPAYPCFIDMEEVGMRIDVDYLMTTRKYLLKRIPIVRDKLCKLWNVPKDFKFNSPDKLGMQIEAMGWPKIEESKKGLYATSDECIQEWKRQGQPGILDLIELRELYSFLGTFIGLESETGDPDDATGWQKFLVYHAEDNSWRVHPNYGVLGTETMRCIGTEPNLQNIPAHSKLSAEVKRCITVATSLRYTIQSDDGNTYIGGVLDTVEVEGRGRISLAEVTENDNIIPGSFIKYQFKYADLFKKNSDNWEEERAKIYGFASVAEANAAEEAKITDEFSEEESNTAVFGFGVTA